MRRNGISLGFAGMAMQALSLATLEAASSSSSGLPRGYSGPTHKRTSRDSQEQDISRAEEKRRRRAERNKQLAVKKS